MAKYLFKIYSPFVGADVVEEIEIDDEELEGKSESEIEDYINEYCHEWMLQTVEYGFEKVED